MTVTNSSIDDPHEAITAETFAEIITNPRLLAYYHVQGQDAQGWFWLESWARGATLSLKQWHRVHDVLAGLFVFAESLGITPEAQDAAANSFDDEALDRGVRRGASQTLRLLVKARVFIGRGPRGE